MRISKARGICMVSVASLVAFVITLLLVKEYLLSHKEDERDEAGMKEMLISKGSRVVISSSRRQLLQHSEVEVEVEGTNRIDKACSKDDIVIYQGEAAALPSGIPAYRVQIMNICASDCSIGDIRVHCGWFSSARLINPTVFRRIEYDDCLVNDGQPFPPGRALSFQYANTFRYPLSVASLHCFS